MDLHMTQGFKPRVSHHPGEFEETPTDKFLGELDKNESLDDNQKEMIRNSIESGESKVTIYKEEKNDD